MKQNKLSCQINSERIISLGKKKVERQKNPFEMLLNSVLSSQNSHPASMFSGWEKKGRPQKKELEKKQKEKNRSFPSVDTYMLA